MKELEPPDRFHWQAAQGWLGLGNTAEASAELEKIAPALRTRPDVLETRWLICAREKKWETCRDIARTITELAPDDPGGWLHLAYSLRRIPGGGLQAAWDLLLSKAEHFPREVTIPFNLACYAAQMQRLDDARHWLEQAFAVAKEIRCHDQVRRMALDDPDLESLWPEIPGK